jgi:small redox-active disulfide protein 2
MRTIKILGSGCANCVKLDALAHEAAEFMGLQAEFVKVKDYAEMAKYNVLSTPGLVINERLVSSGRIPSVAEISTWIADAEMAQAA